MGKAATIVKLLKSSNDEDYRIGIELLKEEYYYDYILDYMSEIVTTNRNKSLNNKFWYWNKIKLKSKRQL